MSLSAKKNDRQQSYRLTFYLSWFLLSLLQAGCSNLIPDEAYYWQYSRTLAWGYFDHPPMIALMIRCGYFLFHNEIGVRLFSILASVGTIYIIECLVKPRKLLVFYMAVASVATLHIVSILAVPDVPLLLFSTAFFWLYKQYIEEEKGYHIILLSIVIALLLLSKYHGILILFFTILSNPKLLLKKSFWLIVSLTATLFLPHVLWQWHHDFPSVKYHLLERNPLAYDISFTLNYLGSVPLIFAPATGILLLGYSLMYKTANSFDRAMKYTLWGTLLFFLLMSFRGRIEANWILFLVIPALYLGYNILTARRWGERFIRVSFVISIVLIMAGRLILVDGLFQINTDFSGWETWASDIRKEAGDEPVAFINSYQKASEYAFYSGGEAFSMNNVMGRKDQYNIWNTENEVQGKSIMLITNFYVDSLAKLETSKGTIQYLHIPSFHSTSNIEITPAQKTVNITKGDNFNVVFTAKVKDGSNVDADANPYFPMLISYQFFNKDGFVSNTVTELRLTNAMLQTGQHLQLTIPPPVQSGDYLLFISVSAGWLPPSINGGKIAVSIR